MENEDRILDSECHYFPLLMVICPSLSRIYLFIYLFTFIYLLGIHRVNPESLKLLLNKKKVAAGALPAYNITFASPIKITAFFFFYFFFPFGRV